MPHRHHCRLQDHFTVVPRLSSERAPPPRLFRISRKQRPVGKPTPSRADIQIT
jgi:hypothetical protein